MKKIFIIIGLMLFLIIPLALTQEPVDLKKLTEAKKRGTFLFESVLKDVDMTTFQKSRQQYAQKYWTLKFENGAVFNIKGSDEEKYFWEVGSIWWVGKKYVVYYEKVGKKNIIHIELIKKK